MIDYGLFQMAAPMYCGEEWIRRAIENAGLRSRNGDDIYTPFVGEADTVLRVGVVRNPYDWLVDNFRAMREGTGAYEDWKLSDPFLALEEFLLAYLQGEPGSVGRWFFRIGADSYVRIEDMPYALLELLDSCGIPKALICRASATGGLPERHRRRGDELRRRVMEHEREFCEHFDYY